MGKILTKDNIVNPEDQKANTPVAAEGDFAKTETPVNPPSDSSKDAQSEDKAKAPAEKETTTWKKDEAFFSNPEFHKAADYLIERIRDNVRNFQGRELTAEEVKEYAAKVVESRL